MPITRTPYFSPTSIGGCALWLDAAQDTTSSGSYVTSLPDRTGNGGTLTPYTANTISIAGNTLNGLPVYNFGIDSASNAGFFWGTTYTQIAVVKCAAGAWLSCTYNGSRYNNFIYSGNWNLMQVNIIPTVNVFDVNDSSVAQGTSVFSTTSGGTSAWTIFCLGYVDGSTQGSNYTLNGTVRTTQTGTPASGTPASYPLWLNGRGGSTGDSSMLAELIHYNAALTTSQRQQVEAYLAQKWGLVATLPQGHVGTSALLYRPVKIGTTTTPLYTQFSPRSIAGCQLWLDGADPAGTGTAPANGATVSTWVDKSGSGYNATGGVSPTYNSSQKAITFNGSSWLTTSYSSVPTNETAFIVFQTTSTAIGNNSFMIGTSANSGRLIMSVNESDGFGLSFKIGSYFVANGSRLSQSQNQIYLGTTTVASTTSYVYLNGTQGPSSSLTYSGTGTTQIGTAVSGSAIYIGYIYEIVIYNTSLTATQRQQIESYLAQKWGLTATLPSFSGPTSIPGCGLWLDAADNSATSMTFSSGSNLSVWKDKSGTGNNFTLTAGTPSNISDGGYSVINIPSGAIMTSANQITFTTSSAFFIVSKLTTNSGITMLLGFTNIIPSGGTIANLGDFSIRFTSANLVGTAVSSGGAGELGNNNFYTNGTFNPSFGSSTYYNVYSIIDTVTPVQSGTSYITLSSAFMSRYYIGNIAEFLYYPNGVTSTQRQQVEGYLAAKWGLQASLSNGHPYSSAAPANHINNTRPAGLPANLTLATVQRGTSYVSYISQILYYSVAPINWTNVWQPYLQQLVAANSGATASISTYSVSGSTASYPRGYGAIAPNGFLYFIGGSGVFVVNPSTNTATIIGSTDTTQYSGLVLGTNGNLYGIPYGSGTVLLITPSSSSPYGTVTTIGSGLDSYQGGCLGPNGTIYALPWVGSNLLTINGNTVTQIAISPRTTTRGSVLGPDGNIYGAPWGTSLILKINPATNTSSTIACNGNTYWGASLAPNGLIYFSPFDPGSFLCLNVVGNIVTNVGSSGTYYCGEVLGPNDKLYLCPYNGSILEYNTATNSTATYSIPLVLNGTSMILAPNGNIYVGGTTSTNGYYISFSGLKQFPSINYCLSAYTNKF